MIKCSLLLDYLYEINYLQNTHIESLRRDFWKPFRRDLGEIILLKTIRANTRIQPAFLTPLHVAVFLSTVFKCQLLHFKRESSQNTLLIKQKHIQQVFRSANGDLQDLMCLVGFCY